MVKSYTARCMKEKKKVTVSNPVVGVNARGSAFVSGTCPSCGGKVYAIIKSSDAPQDIQDKIAKLKASKSRKSGKGERKSRKSGKGEHKSRGSRKSGKGERKSRSSRKSGKGRM